MSNFVFSKTSFNHNQTTSFELVNLENLETGVMVRTALANPYQPFPSIVAFAGARFSRSADTAQSILEEICTNQKGAGQRLGAIFKGYGHASVADMANLFIFIENVPQYIASYFFYSTSVGGGQERSTRYQNFGVNKPISIEKAICHKFDTTNKGFEELNLKFQNLQHFSLQKYTFWHQKIETAFVDYFQIDKTDPKQKSTLNARVFDVCRSFLLFGACNKTSLAYTTSAREWARLIALFKAEKDLNLVNLGLQLETLLAPNFEQSRQIDYYPEAQDLIRYTQADETNANNLEKLKEFLDISGFFSKDTKKIRYTFGRQNLEVDYYDGSIDANTKAVIQNIICLYPNLDFNWVYKQLINMHENWQQELSQILIANFNHHQQMGNSFRVNSDTFLLTCSVAEARDLLRHRAWARFSPLLSAVDNFDQVLDFGYVLPAYLTDIDQFKQILIEFENDLQEYYQKLREFNQLLKEYSSEVSFDYKSFLIQLLPFAHQTPLFLHGSPKEISYLTKLRVRPGGHINYRLLAFKIAQRYAQKSKLNSGFGLDSCPDPNSREEFMDRT
jgi:hypothetical protein